MESFQAAVTWGLIPSMNWTPAITSGSSCEPLRSRQRFCADCISLKTIVRQAVRDPLPLVRLCRSRTVANVHTDRVRRPQVDPVFGREVVEGQQRVAILRQALSRLGVLALVGGHEQVERLLGIGLRRSHPDLMQLLLGLRLQSLRQLVEHVGRLMNPAALLARLSHR